MEKKLPTNLLNGKWPTNTFLQNRLRELKFKELGLEGKVVVINSKNEKGETCQIKN